MNRSSTILGVAAAVTTASVAAASLMSAPPTSTPKKTLPAPAVKTTRTALPASRSGAAPRPSTRPFSMPPAVAPHSANAATQQGGALVGTHFFYWYDVEAHDGTFDTNRMPYHPPGVAAPYRGTFYSAASPAWYDWQLDDLDAAGMDYMFPVSWGSGAQLPSYFRQSNAVPLLCQAIARRSQANAWQRGRAIRVGLYDDTFGELTEYNFDQNPHSGDFTHPAMPLDVGTGVEYIYNRKIKPFFQAVPRALWATHNGDAAPDGANGGTGRPLVLNFIYRDHYTNPQGGNPLGHGPEVYRRIKQLFEADFGVEPFIVLSWDWYNDQAVQGLDWSGAADAECIYGAAGTAGTQTYTMNGYTISNLGPGRAHASNGTPVFEQVRWGDADGSDDHREDQWLRDNFAKIPQGVNLVVLESWNELFEGSSLSRCEDFPRRDGGGALPDDYYIQHVRPLIDALHGSNPPPPPPSLPDLVVDAFSVDALVPGQPAVFHVTVRNAGTATVPAGDPAFGVAILVDGNEVTWTATRDALAPGATVTLTSDPSHPWIPSTARPDAVYSISALVDDSGRVVESNEDDNFVEAQLAIVGSPERHPFSDVHDGDFFADGVVWMFDDAIVSGYADGTFHPGADMTRQQLAKVAVLALNEAFPARFPIVDPSTATFSDVPVGSAFFPFVETAARHGLLGARSGSSFEPGAPCTRREVCRALVLGRGLALATPTGLFSDVPPSDPDAAFIETAKRHGIVGGYGDGSFHPDATATRGQIAKIVFRTIGQP